MSSNLFIISGPSGAGEDSIINGLKKIFDIEKIVTTTTRPQRVGEIHGQHYYFSDKEVFQKNITNNNFFEWAEQDGGNLYGVTFEEIERVKNSGKIGIWKIDYKGVINAKKIIPEIPVIYIEVPLVQLGERIKKRDNASEEFIQRRLEYATGWHTIKHLYSYTINNEDGKLEEAIAHAAEIIRDHCNKTGA